MRSLRSSCCFSFFTPQRESSCSACVR
ncbi:(2Fe-2S)-binding protein [Citrobacter portucalensis]